MFASTKFNQSICKNVSTIISVLPIVNMLEETQVSLFGGPSADCNDPFYHILKLQQKYQKE